MDKQLKYNVAFLYPKFYPVTGGGSVHGYYLASNLNKLGINLNFIYGKEAIPFGINNKFTIKSIIKVISQSDLIYIRHGARFSKRQSILIILSWLFRKKIIIEFNGSPDELLTKRFSKKYVKRQEHILSFLLSLADAIITISQPMREFCINYLNCDSNKINVIPNGGSKIDKKNIENPNETVNEFLQQYTQTALWSGRDTLWQGFDKIEKIIKNTPGTGYIMAVKKLSNSTYERLKKFNNVMIFNNIKRELLEYFILNCDIGLVLYGDNSWSRVGFYNSSLKYYEYLINGLQVISEDYNNEIINDQNKFENLHIKEGVDDIIQFINNNKLKRKVNTSENHYRNWNDVAKETIEVFDQVLINNGKS